MSFTFLIKIKITCYKQWRALLSSLSQSQSVVRLEKTNRSFEIKLSSTSLSSKLLLAYLKLKVVVISFIPIKRASSWGTLNISTIWSCNSLSFATSILLLYDLKFYWLSLSRRSEPFSVYRCLMNEYVFGSIIGDKKSKTLFGVEPLYGALNCTCFI